MNTKIVITSVVGVVGYWLALSASAQDMSFLDFARTEAAQGDVTAQLALATAFRYGLSPEDMNELGLEDFRTDDKEAARWYLACARSGNSECQSNLAEMYWLGEGVPADASEAVKWAKLAAKKGHSKSQYILGRSSEFGTGLPVNFEEALNWYKLAAEQELPEAQFALGVAFSSEGIAPKPNEVDAFGWFERAAEQGHLEAQLQLYIYLSEGRGIEKDHQLARTWLFRSACSGHPRAQAVLGANYSAGDGLPESVEEAYFWFSLAAAELPDARSVRDSFRELLPADRVLAIQRRAVEFKPSANCSVSD